MAGLFDVEQKEDNKYSKYAGAPQYQITSTEQPNIASLTNSKKCGELIYAINSAFDVGKITAEEADFLKLAAYRHIRFNYAQIAEYYAWANKDMQRLMEESALVIIDYEDAIALGYAKLSKELDKVVEKNRELKNEK